MTPVPYRSVASLCNADSAARWGSGPYEMRAIPSASYSAVVRRAVR